MHFNKVLLVTFVSLVLSACGGGSGGSGDSEKEQNKQIIDSDKDGVEDSLDAFPNDPSEQLDTDGDRIGDNADAFKNIAAASVDEDKDGLPDSWNKGCDTSCQISSGLTLDQMLNDTDNDGANNDEDAFPNDPSEQLDSDNDKVGDNTDPFKNNAAASVDADEDGLPDQWNEDCDTECQNNSGLTLDQMLNDTDNDGANNDEDAFPQDPLEQLDSDNDKVGDNADAYKNNAAASIDEDEDGLPDSWNESCDAACQNSSGLVIDQYLNDSDNDGSENGIDAFPLNPAEQLDSDNDKIGDNADAFKNNAAASSDEDQDGYPDGWNSGCNTACQNNSGLTLDTYLNDSDNDGVNNFEDDLPLDPTETVDTDKDGVGDNADAFDYDFAVSVDEDADGLADAWNEGCDIICQGASGLTLDQHLNDTDNDGAENGVDQFPLNPEEQLDSDGDKVGDNADAFKDSTAASIDADKDGLPDSWNESCNADCQNNSGLTLDQMLNDTDNDGANNDEDAFPQDPSEQLDSDNDKVGDNTDAFKDNPAASIDADEDGYPDLWNEGCDTECQINSGLTIDLFWNDTDNDDAPNNIDEFPLDPREQFDLDKDGVGDNADAFDYNPAVSVDADGDGYPDGWNEGCDEVCQRSSDLPIDQYLNDTDNDGSNNDEDAFPNDPSEQLDSDNDKVGDNADAFKDSVAASVDADQDGLPDLWNEGCNTDCQNNSGLTLDQRLNDTDNDGYTNDIDDFPSNPLEWVDTDGDNIGNNADSDDDGDNILDQFDPKPLDKLNRDVVLDDQMDWKKGAGHRNDFEYAFTGTWTSGIGDINNDGKDDFAISWERRSDTKLKVITVVFGGNRQDISRTQIDRQRTPIAGTTFEINGLVNVEGNYKLGNYGDINGDKIDDLVLLGVHAQEDGGGLDAARGYIYFGKPQDQVWPIDLTLSDADVVLDFGSGWSWEDASIDSAGDFNKDGINDLVIGLPGQVAGGRAYVLLGRSNWTENVQISNGNTSYLSGSDGMLIKGEGYISYNSRSIKASGNLGSSVSGVGDVNKDGYDDIIVTAPYLDYYDNNIGGAFVVFGQETLPSSFELSSVNGSNGAFLNPGSIRHPYGKLGTVSSGIGDINDDGYPDFIIGSLDNDAIVVYGKQTWNATQDLGTGTTVLGAKVRYLKKINDFNNDGIDDLLLGRKDSLHILFGTQSFHSTWNKDSGMNNILSSTFEGFDGKKGIYIDIGDGSTIGFAGDVDGDGKADLIMGDMDLNDFAVPLRGVSRLLYGYYP